MKLGYSCKVKLKVSNGKGATCSIITYIRNNYRTYDLYDFVETVDIKGLTNSQKRRVRETFGLPSYYAQLVYNHELHCLTPETQLRYQIIRIY